MTYNFDEVIERRGTDSVKWDGVKSVWGRDDLLPMWVADMDFRSPDGVQEALGQIVERGSHEALLAQKGEYYQLYRGMFELS